MSDYTDRDVTDRTPQQLDAFIRLQLQEHPSVQLFHEIDDDDTERLIARVWHVDFEVDDFDIDDTELDDFDDTGEG